MYMLYTYVDATCVYIYKNHINIKFYMIVLYNLHIYYMYVDAYIFLCLCIHM